MVATTANCVIRYDYAGMAVRLNYVLFPVQKRPFLERLGKEGFTIISQPKPQGNIEVDVIGTPIATLGASSLFLDPVSQQFVLRGLKIGEVAEHFQKLMDALEGAMEGGVRTVFYECHGTYSIRTGKDPLLVISGTATHRTICESLSQKFDITVGEITHRFVLRDTEPNSSSWFELRIEPVIVNPRKEYFCDLIYRNGERKKVFQLAQSMDNLVLETVVQLEKASA